MLLWEQKSCAAESRTCAPQKPFFLSKKMSQDFENNMKMESVDWLSCCSGGWDDMSQRLREISDTTPTMYSIAPVFLCRGRSRKELEGGSCGGS